MKQNVSPVTAIIVIVVVVAIAAAAWWKFSGNTSGDFGKAGTETSAGMPPSAQKALADVMKNAGKGKTAPGGGGGGTLTPGLGGGTPTLPGQPR